jgi:hypothetical protein
MSQVGQTGRKIPSQTTDRAAAKPPANSDCPTIGPRDTFISAGDNGNNSGHALWSTAKSKFGAWDEDRNGHLTNNEIEIALKSKNLSINEKAALETLRGGQSQLEESNNDEWGNENGGTTLKDLDAFRTAGDGEARRLQEQFGIELGLASEPQSVRERARAKSESPADLSGKFGTRDYYIERYKDFRRRNPGEKAPDYYMNYGLKYFDRFHALKDQLRPVSQGWVDRTASNLQKEMEGCNDGASFAQLERNSDSFKSFAFGSHASAYLDAGLQHVPYGDRVKIGMTPDTSDLMTVDGAKHAIHAGGVVVAQDIRNGAVAVGKWVGGLF